MTMIEGIKKDNIHTQSGLILDMIIKSSLLRNSLDNVTCVFLAFSNFEKYFNNCLNKEENIKKIESNRTKQDNNLNLKIETNKFQSNKEIKK